MVTHLSIIVTTQNSKTVTEFTRIKLLPLAVIRARKEKETVKHLQCQNIPQTYRTIQRFDFWKYRQINTLRLTTLRTTTKFTRSTLKRGTFNKFQHSLVFFHTQT